MYDYKFVKVEVDKWKGQPKEDYKRIIAEHAEDGWKLVQLFAPAIAGYANYFEIIFERPNNSFRKREGFAIKVINRG